MCIGFGLLGRLCRVNADGTFADGLSQMTDTTCPCNREHSHCTIALADDISTVSITTNVNAVVTDHSVTVVASFRSFALQTHTHKAPSKTGNVVVTVRGSDNVLLATTESEGIILQRASDYDGHTLVVAQDTLLSFVDGAVRVGTDASPSATSLGCHAPTDAQPLTLPV